MSIQVDIHAGVPIYVQVADRIRHMIATGKLAPGDQLPTIRKLAQDLHVNFNTIARAYAILDEAGVISTQQGRGTYVRERANGHALGQMRSEKLRLLANRTVVEALNLGYEPAEILQTFEDVVKDLGEESER